METRWYKHNLDSTRILAEIGCNPTEIAIYYYLAEKAHKVNRAYTTFNAPASEIKSVLNISDKCIKYSIKHMKQLGVISAELEHIIIGGQPRQVNSYHINWEIFDNPVNHISNNQITTTSAETKQHLENLTDADDDDNEAPQIEISSISENDITAQEVEHILTTDTRTLIEEDKFSIQTENNNESQIKEPMTTEHFEQVIKENKNKWYDTERTRKFVLLYQTVNQFLTSPYYDDIREDVNRWEAEYWWQTNKQNNKTINQ